MQIEEVEPMVVESAVNNASLPSDVGERAVEISSVITKVKTDSGITGYGESFYRSIPDNKFLAESIESLSRHIIGENPLNVTKIWHALYVHAKRSGGWGAMSAIDEALWDIKGKVADQPIYELLGGKTTDISAYATFPIAKDEDELVDDAAWLAEKGFEAMKVGAGYGVDKDKSRIETISQNLPEDFGLAIDANTSYNISDALAVAEYASKHNLEWFEEPIAHTDITGQAELNKRVSIPISGYQTHAPHYPAVDHLQEGALDIYQPTLTYAGGITGACRVATLVEAFNKRLVPHALGPGINYAASLHLAASSPVCSLIEFAVLSDEHDDPGEYIAAPHISNNEVISVQDGGKIEPPEKPGLGVQIDEGILEENRIS
jgi:D-galactarolactone cycloisomerase